MQIDHPVLNLHRHVISHLISSELAIDIPLEEVLAMSTDVGTMAIWSQKRFGRCLWLTLPLITPSGCGKGFTVPVRIIQRSKPWICQGSYALLDGQMYPNYLLDAPSRTRNLEETKPSQYRSVPRYCIRVWNAWCHVVGVVVDVQ